MFAKGLIQNIVSSATDITFTASTKTIASSTSVIGKVKDGDTITVSGTTNNNGVLTVNGDPVDDYTIVVTEALIDESPASTTISPTSWADGAKINIPILFEEDSIATDGYGFYSNGGSTSSLDPASFGYLTGNYGNGLDFLSHHY